MCGRRYSSSRSSCCSSFSRSSWSRSARGLLLFALTISLSLLSSPLFAQSSPPTSPIGERDYLQYKLDSETVEARLQFYRDKLQQAISETSTIRSELEKLKAEQAQHSSDSTTSYDQQQQTIKRLSERLSASETSVSELRASLASAQADYDQKLAEAAKSARRLECWNKVLAVVAIAAALEAGYIGLHAGGVLP